MGAAYTGYAALPNRNTTSSGTHNHVITISHTGGNARHENRPPYEVVWRWKRMV